MSLPHGMRGHAGRFFSLLVLVFLSPKAQAQPTIFKGKAGLGVVDNAIETFQNSIVPSFLRFVNGQVADSLFQSVSIPINLLFGAVTGSFDMGINSIALVEDVQGISIKVDPGDDDASVRVGTELSSLSAILDQFTMGLSLSVPIFGDISCGVTVGATGTLPPVGFGVISALEGSNQAATVAAESIRLAFPKFEIGTPTLTGDCERLDANSKSAVAGFVSNEINNFIAGVTDVANGAISAVQNNFVSQFGILRLPLPPAIAFDVFPGRTIEINPTITKLRANMNPVTNVATEATSQFQARLSQPAHRAGSAFAKEEIFTEDVPEPSADQLINFHISAEGLNSLFMPAWYLMWSTLATDPEATKSSLCEPMAADTCPFPPVRQQANMISNILLLLTTFPVFGPMFNFNFEVVAKPPSVDFDPNNFITGSTSAGLLLRASPLFGGEERELALLDVATDVSARVPNYDSRTGFFSGFALDSQFRVEDAEIGGLFGGIAEWALRGPLTTAVNFAFNFGFINDILNQALGRIPFKVPDIPIPLLDVTLRTEFAGAFGESVPATDTVGSFLRFGSDFVVSATPDRVESVTIAKTVFDTPAYASAVGRTSDTNGKTYTTMVYDPKRKETRAFTVRRGAAGLEQLDGNQWVPV